MYEVLKREELNFKTTRIKIAAPFVARHAEPGQFIILRVTEEGERIPLTISDYDREKGTVSVIFQTIGATTVKLNHVMEGECLADVAGPLGNATETDGLKKVAVVGGGVGCAIAYPIAKKLHNLGAEVHLIVGFRDKANVIMEDEYKTACSNLVLMTDDGSYCKKGMTTQGLQELLDAGHKFDEVIAIGPLVMMKFICKLTKQYNVKTIVSMNPIMVDATGMCGCCRLTVGGETKFACVDGPDFDGHLVDFDEVISRNSIYNEFERHAHEETCHLFEKKPNIG